MRRRLREPPLHLVDRCLPGRSRTRPGGGPKDPGSCSRCIAVDPQRSQRDAGLPVRPSARGTGCEGSTRNFRGLVSGQKAFWRRDPHTRAIRGGAARFRPTAVGRVGRRYRGDWAGAAGVFLLRCQGYGRRPSPSAEIRRPRLRSRWAGVGSAVLETSSRVVPSVRRFWRTPRSGCTRTRAERA